MSWGMITQKPVRPHAAHPDSSDLFPGEKACPYRGSIIRDASLVKDQGWARPEEAGQREEGAAAEKENVRDGHSPQKDVLSIPEQGRT